MSDRDHEGSPPVQPAPQGPTPPPVATRPPLPLAFRDRFTWHPEPDLLGVRDPAASRAALEAAGAAAWDAGLDYLYDHALDRAMGDGTGFAELRERYFGPTGGPGPAPRDPRPLGEVLEAFRTRIAPHTASAWHPRSFGYFTPPPLVASIVGEVVGQFAQQGVDVWHAGPIGAIVEEEVVRWLCDVVGYGPEAFGLLTSGGVMANFIAMALVRDVQVPIARGIAEPPRGRALEGLRVYAGDQGHFSIGRALDELGFPPGTLVTIATDDEFRLRASPVAAAIAADRAAGRTPVAIAAVAGSTNTGAVDAIGELAEVAAGEGLWLHVDAAYGAAARLSPRDAARVPELERADSVTVDPHKWFFQAYDIGGLMVRDGGVLERAFGGHRPEYYRAGHGSATRPGPAAGEARAIPGEARRVGAAGPPDAADPHDTGLNFWKLGFEGTRRFRALKLWFSWHHLGTAGFARLIEANGDLARHLADAIRSSGDFEARPAVPSLSVVCFRHRPPGLVGAALDAHQDRLQLALERSGAGWVTTTRLRGETWLRAGILNTQATEADADGLLATLRELAAGLTRGPGD